LDDLLLDIQLDYIQTSFVIQSIEQFRDLNAFLSDNQKKCASIEIDLINYPTLKSHLQELSQTPTGLVQFVVNGYEIQQRGATTWQETGFCLATGHEYIHLSTEHGFTLDEACRSITFNLGAGANYFYEIAKLKVLSET